MSCLYNPGYQVCYINSFPLDCENTDSACTRAGNSGLWAVTYIAILWIAIFGVIFMLLGIVRAVRKTDSASERRRASRIIQWGGASSQARNNGPRSVVYDIETTARVTLANTEKQSPTKESMSPNVIADSDQMTECDVEREESKCHNDDCNDNNNQRSSCNSTELAPTVRLSWLARLSTDDAGRAGSKTPQSGRVRWIQNPTVG